VVFEGAVDAEAQRTRGGGPAEGPGGERRARGG